MQKLARVSKGVVENIHPKSAVAVILAAIKTGNDGLFQRPFTLSGDFIDSFGDSSGTDTGGLSSGSLDWPTPDHP